MLIKCYYSLFLLFLAGSLAAQDLSFFENMFVGAGAEVNGYTRSGFSIGGGLMLGMDLNSKKRTTAFALGQKSSFFTDMNTVRVVELLVFFRYYLPWLRWPSGEDGLFAQIEAGTALSIEHGYHIYNEVFPSFAAGATAGWRFSFLSNWFIEPSVRIGYPYYWGAGLTAGLKIKSASREQSAENMDRLRGDNLQRTVNREQITISKEQIAEISEMMTANNDQITEIREQATVNNNQITESSEKIILITEEVTMNKEQITEIIFATETREVPWRVLSFTNERGVEEPILIVRGDDGRLRVQTEPIVFRPNHADFEGLAAITINSNRNTFRQIARMLDAHKEYNLLIEGHANPTTPREETVRQSEESVLRRLSESRAQRAADELVLLGIDRSRLTVTGMGSAAKVAPYNDHNYTWKNRRVEFILIEGENNEQ